MIFVATKKGRTTNFFSPLSVVAGFGSGMDKNHDPRGGWVAKLVARPLAAAAI